MRLFTGILEISLQTHFKVAKISENTIENEYWDEGKFLSEKMDKLWQHLNPELYCIFWYMDVRDFHYPEQLYSKEIKKLQIAEKKNKQEESNLKKLRHELD